MDFTIKYTKEQEEFRKEVRTWLAGRSDHPGDRALGCGIRGAEGYSDGGVYGILQGASAQWRATKQRPHRATGVGLHIESAIQQLLGLRNYWMFNNGQSVTYHGSQNSLIGKDMTMKSAERILEVAGPYAIVSDREWALVEGLVEEHFRHVVASNHRGGTTEVQRLIMARRIGISQTQERAAPTQGTAAG